MPMVSTEADVAKLFLSVLATSEVKLDYPALAQYMGPDMPPAPHHLHSTLFSDHLPSPPTNTTPLTECTTEAIKQKMRELKAAEKNDDTTTGTKLATASGTAATNGKSKKITKAKDAGKRTPEEDIFEGDDSEGTPSKPAKKRVKAAASDVKKVNGDEEENGAGLRGEKTEDGETA